MQVVLLILFANTSAKCNTTEYNTVKRVEQDQEAQKCSYIGPKQAVNSYDLFSAEVRALLCLSVTVEVCVNHAES